MLSISSRNGDFFKKHLLVTRKFSSLGTFVTNCPECKKLMKSAIQNCLFLELKTPWPFSDDNWHLTSKRFYCIRQTMAPIPFNLKLLCDCICYVKIKKANSVSDEG